MRFDERPIAFTDLETTGLYKFTKVDVRPENQFNLVMWNEICEIGLVVADPKTLAIINTFEARVKINRPDRVNPKAREVNGYNEKEWENAMDLCTALLRYNELTKDAVFAAHNVTFDWGFMDVAFEIYNLSPKMDYHRIDLWSYARAILRAKGYELKSYRLSDIAKAVGVPEEPMPHRALNGAMTAYNVYKALRNLPAKKSADGSESAAGCQMSNPPEDDDGDDVEHDVGGSD